MYKNAAHALNRGMPPALETAAVDAPEAPEAVRPDRKAAILLAAERLFAQRGYHAVGIRQIAAEAGVPLALVGYYWGAKHDLFHAIFEHWAPTIDERLSRLCGALSPHQRPALGDIVRAFVEPVLTMRASPEGEFYALLVGRELAYAAGAADRVLRDFFDPLAHAFIDALHAARPGVSREQAAWAYQFALGALLHHISDQRVHRLSRSANRPNDRQAAPLLMAFITAGLDAALQPRIDHHPQETLR